MRKLHGALAMGLIIAVAGALAGIPAFAADTDTTSPPPKMENAPAAPDNAAPATNATDDQSGATKQSDPNNAANTNDNATKSGTTTQAVKPEQAAKKRVVMSRRKIEHIQTALANSGFDVPIDGIWGPKTTAALKDFQEKNRLKPTGRLDHSTIKALPKSTG